MNTSVRMASCGVWILNLIWVPQMHRLQNERRSATAQHTECTFQFRQKSNGVKTWRQNMHRRWTVMHEMVSSDRCGMFHSSHVWIGEWVTRFTNYFKSHETMSFGVNDEVWCLCTRARVTENAHWPCSCNELTSLFFCRFLGEACVCWILYVCRWPLHCEMK